MPSPSEEVEKLRERAAKEQVDIYQQLKEQPVHDAEKYRSCGDDRLATLISESLKE